MAHPEGTKPWRKAWRKRWRPGSSFVALSMPAKLIVMWVEENADDAGSATTTTRYLASVIGGVHRKAGVARMVVWRAIREAARAGMLRIEPGQEAGQEAGHAPTKLTRINFKEYQERDEPTGTGSGTGLGAEPGLSGRRRQKKAEEEKTTAPEAPLPPGTDWSGLLAAMTREWGKRYEGKKLVLQGKDFKPIRTLVVSLTDEEVFRRWVNYLANPDPFYAGHPVALFVSQVNRFVVAPAPAVYREPWEGTPSKGRADWASPTPGALP